MTARLIAFVFLTVPTVWLSWRTLFSFNHHGLYRFISWECILWLLLNNYSFWFADPLSITQIVSWMLLIVSLGLLISGSFLMIKIGEADSGRKDSSLYNFERTTKLIRKGIFKYVRHPLYGSLILLTWGIYFKNMNLQLTIMSIASTLFLILTSLVEEKENTKYFGQAYSDYMQRTKMFVPFIF
ncbi:MAG TPA: methyltransferase [Candidatus Acidoferrales bacterium]|nr:methyltransferase [Candidatus Acidoferrales bacterium]